MLLRDVAAGIGGIVESFTNMLLNSAGKATLTDVSISINAKPQIMLAEVQEVIVPEEGVTPGEDLTVSVVLLPHWSAAGNERTIQRDVTLEIPEDFPVGDAQLTVTSGNAFGPSDPFLGPDFFEFGEPEEEPELAPKNLDEFIKQMEDAQTDPGEITITLASLGTPPDGSLPEDFPFFEDGEMPPEGEAPEEGEVPEEGEAPPEDGEIPPDLLFPEGLPPLDGLPFPTDFEPPPTVEITINIDGFIVTGLKEAFVTIMGEEMADGMISEEIVEGPLPEEIDEPVEPVEPAEEE